MRSIVQKFQIPIQNLAPCNKTALYINEQHVLIEPFFKATIWITGCNT